MQKPATEHEIHLLAGGGSEDGVSLLLRRDPEAIEVVDGDGWTPLLWAAFRKQLGMAKMLIKKGAKIDVRANSGDTTLTAAASIGSKGLIRLFLATARNQGITPLSSFVDAQTSTGYTALMWAVDGGHLGAAEVLLESGRASLSLTTSDGDSPLHIAANNNRPDMVKFLLDRGADVEAVNRTGDT